MIPITRDPEWADMLERCVESALYTPSDASSEVKRAERTSERINFLSEFWRMALERSRDQGLRLKSSQTWNMVEEAGGVGQAIAELYLIYPDAMKFNDPEIISKANMMRKKSDRKPISVLKKWPPNYPTTESLEEACADYFNSRWRSPTIDRFVLRLLLEREVAMFVHEMARDDLLTDGPGKLAQAQATLQRTGFGESVKVLFWMAVSLAAIAATTIVFPNIPYTIPMLLITGTLILGAIWLDLVI